jgi:hypothetical protein
VGAILREAEKMLSENLEDVGKKHASRIWGYMSKYVMLDRISKTLGAMSVYPGPLVPKKLRSLNYFGTAAKVRTCNFFFFSDFAYAILRYWMRLTHPRNC